MSWSVLGKVLKSNINAKQVTALLAAWWKSSNIDRGERKMTVSWTLNNSDQFWRTLPAHHFPIKPTVMFLWKSSMSLIQILPIKLVDHVAHCLPTTDLVALSTISSYLYPVAQWWLYQHITINYSSNNLTVVYTLAHKPHLTCYVRNFAIRLGSFSALLSSFYRLLQYALSNMSKLTSLAVFLHQVLEAVIERPMCYNDQNNFGIVLIRNFWFFFFYFLMNS